MHDASIVMARPDRPAQLVLLFHGVGANAANLAPMGEAIGKARPKAMVVSVDAPHPSALGSGREWFSVIGITEQNRPQRIAQAMPLFLRTIAEWQREAGVGSAETVLVGFSQGAIMSLESTQVVGAPAAQHVIALAGRFAITVRRAAPSLRFNLIHGDHDTVMPPAASIAGGRELQTLGAEVTVAVVPGLGHSIDARALQLVLQYLGDDLA